MPNEDNNKSNIPLPEKSLRFKLFYWINVFLVKMIDHPAFYHLVYLLIPDQLYIKMLFRIKTKVKLNLDSPEGFNQKLQWLKVRWYDPLAIQCADKLTVREYVTVKIGEKYLNELYGQYDSFESIDFNELPDTFVLKTNHGSGSIILCQDKCSFDKPEASRKFKKWLKTNYYWFSREWVYKTIKPRIIAERFLLDENNQPPRDYKIYCFHGEPKLIVVIIDRFSSPKENYYDLDWNFLDLQVKFDSDRTTPLEKPPQLEEMLQLCRALSSPFPHVRVDFYLVKGQIIFGELTFFTTGGFKSFRTPQLDHLLGNWLDLGRIENQTNSTTTGSGLQL